MAVSLELILHRRAVVQNGIPAILVVDPGNASYTASDAILRGAHSVYYFAYGSNMHENDLKKWCEGHGRPSPEWTLLGVACLEGYQLSFNYHAASRNGGAANLMESPDHKVYGLLFDMSRQEDLETIRKKEGHPDIYREVLVAVEWNGESISDVTTYKVVKAQERPGHQKPTTYYMDLILKSARKYGFPPEYIQFLERIQSR